MIVMNTMLLLVMLHFTKTQGVEKKSNFSTLICEKDGCESEENVIIQKGISPVKDGFSIGEREELEKQNNLYTGLIKGNGDLEDVNETLKDDAEFNLPVAEKTKIYTKPNISRKNNSVTNSSVEIAPKSASKTEMDLDILDLQPNSTNIIPVKRDIFPTRSFLKNNSALCICDLKIDECDINCCCDEDCTVNMKLVFNSCTDMKDSPAQTDTSCFSSKSIFKNNARHILKEYGNGLFCVVKNNLKHHLPFNEGLIIKNVTHFKKRLIGKKLFTYSGVHYDEPKMTNTSYHIGDYLWTAFDNNPVPFGVPKFYVNRQCNFVQNIRFLKEYSTECLYSVPNSKTTCEKASQLEMNFFLKSGKIIKSPTFVKKQNFSDFFEICSNNTCADIISYICPGNTDISNCIRAPPRRLLWYGNICRNIVSTVEYHFFHNGTEGISEVIAYFSLKNVSVLGESHIFQRINVKYFWAKTPLLVFTRSGNPGYVIGKPILAGRKIFSNNETSALKKEAIDLSLNPEDWLSVAGKKRGICSSDKRETLNFGENIAHSCFIALYEHGFTKKTCSDVQETIFNHLIGNDYADIKSNSRFNKYVATFGNSRVEDTGDWVQVIIDLLPIVSSQISSTIFNDVILCKNIVADLFIDIAYSKIGSFEKPQNKILGVQFYFGSPRNIVYPRNYNYTGFKSGSIVKISTFVHFIDLTKQPQAEFAETPGLEAKFPHNFFYPFFSASCPLVYPDFFLTFITVALCLYY